MTRESHTEAIGAKLTPSLNARLRAICKRLNISISAAVVEAITEWLTRHEL